jgi:hypothetical protein
MLAECLTARVFCDDENLAVIQGAGLVNISHVWIEKYGGKLCLAQKFPAVFGICRDDIDQTRPAGSYMMGTVDRALHAGFQRKVEMVTGDHFAAAATYFGETGVTFFDA